MHEVRDALYEASLVDLIRQLRHYDRLLAAFLRLDMRLGAHDHGAAPSAVGILYAIDAHYLGASRKIRPLYHRHKLIDGGLGVINQHQRPVDYLGHVMRRDIRCHADRYASRAIDQELRELRREHRGLLQRLVIVRNKLDSILVDVLQHELRDFRHADLGVAHRRRRVAVDRAEIAMTVGERIAHREILRHAHYRVIYGAVAMRMIFTKNLADDTRGLLVGLGAPHARFLHPVEYAAMHGLHAVPHVGQSAGDYDAHRVVNIRRAHHVREIHGDNLILAKIQNLTSFINE